MNTIKLIAGLGNPTKAYQKTRHNVGFWLLDELAKRHSVNFVDNSRIQGLLTNIYWFDEKVYLLKPMTYMNRSGTSVGIGARYFKISPQNILIVHDELDFEVGVTKFKQGGGHGGHNGLRDIVAHLDSSNFCRLRIGVGHPGASEMVTPYVLKNPSAQEEIEIKQAITRAIDLMPRLIQGDYQSFMNSLHSE